MINFAIIDLNITLFLLYIFDVTFFECYNQHHDLHIEIDTYFELRNKIFIDTFKQKRQIFVDMFENINITSKFIEIKIIVRYETISFIQQNSMHISKNTIFENFASNYKINEQNFDSIENQFRKNFRFSKLISILFKINNNIDSINVFRLNIIVLKKFRFFFQKSYCDEIKISNSTYCYR